MWLPLISTLGYLRWHDTAAAVARLHAAVLSLDENYALLPPPQVAASEGRLLPAASWWQRLLTCGCIHYVPRMHQEATDYRPSHVAAAQPGVPGRRCGGDASQAGAAASILLIPNSPTISASIPLPADRCF